VSMITYRADVYRSRPIGASLLAGRGRPAADADRHRCAFNTGWLGVVVGSSAASTGLTKFQTVTAYDSSKKNVVMLVYHSMFISI